MKNRIIIIICILSVSLAIFFGLSRLSINQTQYQQQTQQQIQRNDNIQLTIIDTSKKIERLSWVITNINGKESTEHFINTQLDFFQVRESKFFINNQNEYVVIFPVLNSEIKVFTNSNENYNTNKNEVKIELFKKIKK